MSGNILIRQQILIDQSLTLRYSGPYTGGGIHEFKPYPRNVFKKYFSDY